MKFTYLVVLLFLLILIAGCIQEKQPMKEYTPVIEKHPITSSEPPFRPPKDKFPSKVEGVIRYIDLTKIGPISPDECSKYIKNEPDRSFCYFVLAIRNKDKRLCSFVKNYTIVESGCTCLGVGHGGCCEKSFNWTLNKDRCMSIVEGETFKCPFTLSFRCKYDEFKQSYNLTPEQIRISREFGILCRNEYCITLIAENQSKVNKTRAKEICDSITTRYMKPLCYARIGLK